ncbi:1,4-dihydroxy-2-naphthoyl-CoA hydrolase MenI [Staphylococcus lugdunensis]
MIYSITEIEARYQETDKMGVIYHGNYATWFEVARTDYIRKLGFNYADMESVGIISPVTDLNVKYIKSITYPETVKVKTWVEKYSRLRSIYGYEIYNEQGELATTGTTELICMKADNFRPIRLDRHFPDWHETYSKVEALNKNNIELEVTNKDDLNHL